MKRAKILYYLVALHVCYILSVLFYCILHFLHFPPQICILTVVTAVTVTTMYSTSDINQSALFKHF
jgi:hypothetical protein